MSDANVKKGSFEGKLCQKIVDICCGIEQNKYDCYNTEKSIQNALATSLDATKEEKIHTEKIRYISAIDQSQVLCNSGFARHISSKKPPPYEDYEDFEFAVDISTPKATKKILIEMKHPKLFKKPSIDNRWHYLQCDCDPSLASDCPFTTPFTNSRGSHYLSDVQEGSMFIDFIRLLGMQKSLSNFNPKLYFVAFLKEKDFAASINGSRFELRLGKLLQHYFNEKFEFAVTVGKDKDHPEKTPLDFLIPLKPSSIDYFIPSNDFYGCKTFEPNNPMIKCLHCDDTKNNKLRAFLLRLNP